MWMGRGQSLCKRWIQIVRNTDFFLSSSFSWPIDQFQTYVVPITLYQPLPKHLTSSLRGGNLFKIAHISFDISRTRKAIEVRFFANARFFTHFSILTRVFSISSITFEIMSKNNFFASLCPCGSFFGKNDSIFELFL